ncbi:MAG TPA: ABC transporter substrate-binding protein [Anaerolineae bacterium]|nr:ABC transporter substrate-binding protein [Anaerolineae bacterium]
MLELVAAVTLLATTCGPVPTSLPTVSTAALVSATPSVPPPTAVALPKPTLEPVTSSFLYVDGVTVSTLAGDGHWGHRDGPGAQARFVGLEGVAIDEQGSIYIAERFGNRIRRISPDGMVSTLAGTGVPGYAEGPAPSAQFNFPFGIAVDVAGNVYVADAFNHRIRVIHPGGAALPAPPVPTGTEGSLAEGSSSAGTVSTLAGDGEAGYRDGPALQARFDRPTGVALSATGVLYVADAGNNRVRAISPDGIVTTLAGSGERGFKDGPPDQAQFNGPQYITVDGDGNIYAADSISFELRGNHAIRRITPDGIVTTVAGTGRPGRADGPAADAGFALPSGLDVDASGNLFVADEDNQRIRIITPQGMVYTLAGIGTNGYADGAGSEAAFFFPHGVALDGAGRLYVAESATSRIRVIQLPQTLVAAPPIPTPSPYAGQNVIKIGFVDDSNRGSYYSVTTGNAVQLAIDEANAAGGVMVGEVRHTFALVRAQDWYQPPDAGAQAAARTLVNQGVVAVIGHIVSENSMAGAEVYGPAGVVMVSPSSSDPRVTQAGWSTVYRVTSNDAFMAPVSARMTYEDLGLRRVVLLGEMDPHVKTAMDAWQGAFEALGGQVLGRFEGEVEFSEAVLAQVKTLTPEAVIFFPGRKLSIIKAAQQMLETDMDALVVGVESFSVDPAFLSVLGEIAEGVYDAVPGQPNGAMPGYAGFAERYRQAGFAIMPDPNHLLAKWAPFAYDAAGVIIAAIRQAAERGEVTRESVATAMETFRDQPYQDVTGVIQFDEFGDLLDQPVYFLKVVSGQWVDVMPGER